MDKADKTQSILLNVIDSDPDISSLLIRRLANAKSYLISCNSIPGKGGVLCGRTM